MRAHRETYGDVQTVNSRNDLGEDSSVTSVGKISLPHREK